MRFGLHLTHYRPKGAGDPSVEFAQQAEELNFHSVWAGDHVVSPEYVNTIYPHGGVSVRRTGQATGGMPDPFVLMAVIGGKTKTIKLGFDVIIVPYRPPLLTAKQIATLDSFTNGRVIVGIGVGWHEQEFEALGVPFKTRGSRTDETVEIWRKVWSGENVSHHGKHFRFDSLFVLPTPVQPGGPPIWIGGDGAQARARVARYGDGWMPTISDIHRLKEQHAEIVEQAAALGRPRPESVVANRIMITDTPQTPDQTGYGPIAGTPDQVIAVLKAYEAAGIDEVIVMRSGEDPAELAVILRAFEREILPAFK